MITGKRAFEGKSQASLIGAIMEHDPRAVSELQPMTPSALDRVINKCLSKEPDNRWQSAKDLHDELKWIADGGSHAGGAGPLVVSRTPSRRLVAVLATTIGALVASVAVWSLIRSELTTPTITRFPLTLPPGDVLSNTGRHVVALSPDGTRFVYSANNQLYLREMGQLEAAPIRGTDGGREPFFSPDSQALGFWADGQLKKISVTGGAPITLCEAGNPYGASWGVDDTILFGQREAGILRVSANGGTPEVLISMDADKNEWGHGPQMLPDETVLFTLANSATGTWDASQIVTQSLETGERRVLIDGGTDARYLPTGHLVYALGETLLAVPFDLARLAVTGGPVPVVEGVGHNGTITGAAHASFSDSGSLLYVPATSLEGASGSRELVWVDREGAASPVTETFGDWETPRLSPDGQRLAVRRTDETGQQVWVLGLSRGTLTRLTFENGLRPLWSPDGQTIFFGSNRAGGNFNIFSKLADGSGPAEQLTTEVFRVPASITSDGKTLVLRQGGDSGSPNLDIGILGLEGEGEPEMLLETSFNEHTPKLSPDDRWLAYVSNESDRDEVYVTGFPPAGKWQISAEGGNEPMWSRDGRELFYRNGEKMMAVDVSAGPQSAGKPNLLFEGPYDLKEGSGASNYDVAPDGQGFVMIRTPERAQSSGQAQQIILVQNWFEELKRLVPTDN